ncbi:hypothetical protein [Uliginosibacterium sp. TH139]|uniref:hypothetical protein n=1 Tax=Uliginosibacterium sp. TH139 TaxID=2067453 RepID=UPI0013047598|nr:hypothetical protein [Uliginosibacterium sp. TH139]
MNQRRSRPAGWLAWLGLCCLVAASPAHAAPERFEDTLCVTAKFSQGQPLSELPMLTDLGVKWVRDTVAWFDIEKRPGQYQAFPPEFQQRLDFYRQHDIGLVMLLAYDNPLAYPNTPAKPGNSADPVAYGRYAAEMARRLRTQGLRFVIELWNEPHNDLFHKFGGNWNGAPPSPWVDHYLRMVDEATQRIKLFDPSIRVITDDDMWVIHYHFLARGLTRQIDGFAIHPYTGGDIPELTAVTYDTDWTRPYQVVDPDRSFGSAMRRLREFGSQKLGKRPEIWITEWGWGVGEKAPLGPLSEEAVATYLPRAMVLGAATGAEATCWFSTRDSVDGPMGLTDNNSRPRPAYYAFRDLHAKLGKARYVCPLSTQSGSGAAMAYLFRDAKGPLVARWDAYPAVQGAGKLSLERPATAPACARS